MTGQNIEEQLKSVGLRMPLYWSVKYLKNVENLSKPQYKVREERDVYMTVRDGVKLCLDVFRPDAEGKFPALFADSAYGKDVQSIKIPPQPFQSVVFDHTVEAGDVEFFVSRGYVYVIVDPRGVGKSEGEWYGPYNIKEQEDCHDVIEWIAQQPWCNGNVGMTGISWFGVIQPLAAAQQPPHLKAIFPIEAFDDLYRRAYSGGIISPFYWDLENYCVANNAKLESEILYSPEELNRRLKERLKDPDIQSISYFYRALSDPKKHTAFADMLLHPTDGPFWWERSSYTKHAKIKIPVYAGGFWCMDQFTRSLFNCFTDPTLTVPKKVGVFFYWTKISLPFRDLNLEILRWYDHWLKGVDTGIMDEPPIKIFVMGIKRFRYENEWPLARTRWTKYYLRRFSQLDLDPEDDEEIPPDALIHTPPTISNKIHSITYTTSPLTNPLEITGPSAAYLYASIDQKDANFIVKLWDVSPYGEKILLEASFLRASHRALDDTKSKPWQPYHPHTRPEPVEPGKIYEYAIPIAPISNVFQPNHQLEVEITTMDPIPLILPQKMTLVGHLPSSNLTFYKIYRDSRYQSHLLLPIIHETPPEAYLN